MISLLGGDLASFAPQTGPKGPVLESASVTVAASRLADDDVEHEYSSPRRNFYRSLDHAELHLDV